MTIKDIDQNMLQHGINLNVQRLECCVLHGLVLLMIILHDGMTLPKSEAVSSSEHFKMHVLPKKY